MSLKNIQWNYDISLKIVLVNFVSIFFYLKFQIKDECECANGKVWGLIQPLDYVTWFSLAGYNSSVSSPFSCRTKKMFEKHWLLNN